MEKTAWINFLDNNILYIIFLICFVILLFKEPITKFVNRILEIRGKHLKIILAKTNDNIEKITENKNISKPTVQQINEYEDISKVSSVAAILYAYSKLEIVMKEKLKQLDPLLKKYLENDIPKLLLKHEKINREVFDIIIEMRKFRNESGRDLLELGTKVACDYGKNIEVLINIINSNTSK